MDSLFGVSMNSIMLVLLVLLGLALAVLGYVALRNRIVFLIGLRNIPRRPSRTILIVLGLMLSTLIISAAFTTGDTINRSISAEAYDVLGHVDETIQIGEDLDEGVDIVVRREPVPQSLAAELEERLGDDKEIDGLMPVIVEPVAVLNPRSLQSEPLVVLVGVDTSRIGAFPDIVDGEGRPVDVATLADDEVLVNESLADELSAEPGDLLEVFSENQRFTFQVAGIVQDRLLSGATPFRRLGMVTRIEVLQEAFDREGEADFIAVSNQGGVRDGLSVSDSVTAKLRALLRGESGLLPEANVDPIKAEGVESAEDVSSFMVTFFVVFGLFSIAAGMLLIFMTFTMLAAERKSEMGISRALGMKRRHLVQMFLAEGMGYNVAAAAVGVTLGVLVALAMTRIMAILFAQFDLVITFHVTWRSLIISYCLGVVLTFVTVAFSSWRVSALNIVRAIRDVPEPKMPRASRRALFFGIAGILLGLLISRVGLSSDLQAPFALGVTLIILGVVSILRYKGVRERPVFTFAGLGLLAFWILGAGGYLEGLTGKMEADIEMFFLSGMVMVLASTFVLVYNADFLLRILDRLGGNMRRFLPAVKTAVAYPLASKMRTGMTMAMMSLVIFALVMMSTMNANFSRVFLSDDARGGWDVAVTENPGIPLVDLREILSGAPGVDTEKFEAVGRVEPVVSRPASLRQSPDGEFDSYPVRAVDREFLTENRIRLQARATGFESDSAVWEAMANDPSMAVIDALSLGGGFGGGMGDADFTLKGIDEDQHTFDPITIEIRDDLTERKQELTLVGIIGLASSHAFHGLHTSEETIRQVFGLDRPDFTVYLVRLAPGEDAKATAQAIEAALITSGVQAESIKDEMEDQQRLSNGFFWLLQGFMGLGLLVGVAAVGVIAFRTVVERRKQIGMLRAIGYQRNMVGLSFLLESSFIALLGILSGVGLAILLAFMLLNSSEFQNLGIDTFVIPWWQILLIVAFAYGASLLMSVIPSRRAASLPIADALRYE